VQHYSTTDNASKDKRGEVSCYLDAFKKELKFWGARLSQSATGVSSIYIGGGNTSGSRTETTS
jgi:coproporphyrinogen III oxidase-like Fe-S oxidoreductase